MTAKLPPLRRVLKWTVFVDDGTYWIGGGPVVHVACQHDGPDFVQVWTEELTRADSLAPRPRPVRVFGTGQEIPDPWRHVGTAIAAGGGLVWHVYEGPRS